MKKISLCLAILCIFSTALSASARKRHKAAKTEKINYIDHLKAVNGAICEKYLSCGMVGDAARCRERLNGVTESNVYNMNTTVYKHRSEKCREYLAKESACSDVSKKSIEGPCHLKELNKK